MKRGEIQVRRDICADCTRKCAVRDTINHEDPCAGCPDGVYHEHSDCDPSSPAPILGLGDLIHAVALPIARAIRMACVDPDTKKLRPYSPCAARRKKMNEVFPFTSPKP